MLGIIVRPVGLYRVQAVAVHLDGTLVVVATYPFADMVHALASLQGVPVLG